MGSARLGKTTRFSAALLFILLASLIGDAATGASSPRVPLLIEGKKTIYQRVITHPGADIYASAASTAKLRQRHVKPFSVYYVYQRAETGDEEWLEVGIGSTGQTDGWLRSDAVSEWKQALTLKFTERTGRSPVLFFKELESLETVAASPDPGQNAKDLAAKFVAIQSGQAPLPADFPLRAMEPSQEAVARDRFYLMPIFKTLELFEGVKFLQIASIDPGDGEPVAQVALKTGIVFVIDTTISMKPYIERTRKVVRQIYDAIDGAGLSDKVAFGLVGYRSSVEKNPEVEYVSKVYAGLLDGRRRTKFEDTLSTVNEARVSTHSFNEDAFAGIKTAVERIDWTGYPSRLMLLITDAGPILNDDPSSATGMNSAEVADLVGAKGIKVFALHLKTPLGGPHKLNNHYYAETEYRKLTGQADKTIGDLYVPIDASTTGGGVQDFSRVVEKVAGQMVELVRATAAGERLSLPDAATLPAGGDAVQEAERKAAILGYAMQLEFLGEHGQARAPEVVSAWVSDMDLQRPDRPAFQVTLMLTRNQLSDLFQRLRIILDQAQRTKRTGARDFFQSILSAATQLSRDPIQFSQQPGRNLGQLGILAEFLEDLPYRSSIMRLTEDDWYRMSVGEQQALVDDIKSKLRRYRQYYNDVDNWVSLGAEDAGDATYRVPLAVMP